MNGTLMRGPVNGRWGAMVTLSAGPRRWAADVRAYWLTLALIRRVFGLPNRLVRLSMIGFARWSIVSRVPAKANRRRSTPLGRPFLLFESNFNGDSDGYLESFSLIVPNPMNRQWMGEWVLSYEVPDAKDTSRWLEYVRKEKEEIAFYYAGYPQASVKTIRSALALEQMVADFRARAGSMTEATFEAEFRNLLTRVQRIRNPRVRGRGPRTGSLSTFVPIGESRRDQLVQGLERLRESAPVPDATHFARWCIVDKLRMPERFRNSEARYLLFSAWFDGDPRHYPGALYEHMGADRVNSIWSHCGFQGTDAEAFAEYLWRYRVQTGTAFAGYDRVTVAEIRTALDCWRRFQTFAVAAQDQRLTGDSLRQAWRRELA